MVDNAYYEIMRNFTKYGFLFISIVTLVFSANAQEIDIDPMLIHLKAQVVSKGDSAAVPYATVINFRTKAGIRSNVSGYFSMEMLNIDSLVITAVGFKTTTARVPADFHEDNMLMVYMEPIVYPLGEVEVTGEAPKVNTAGIPMGKPNPIPVEMRGDAFNEKPPILAAFFSPISYMQYYLSRKEKNKRKVRAAVQNEKLWEAHSKNYNKEVVMRLTGLNNEQADDFIIWFNAQGILPYTASEYETQAAIREYFLIYSKEKSGMRD